MHLSATPGSGRNLDSRDQSLLSREFLVTRPNTDPDPAPEPLLGVRAALILTLALAAGAVAGALTLWADASLPAAILAGLTTTGGAVRVLNDIIAKR